MNGLLKDVKKIEGCFCEESLAALQSVFENSNNSTYETTDLNERLLSVLQWEESHGHKMMWRKTSPDGKNHIVVCNELCFLVNIHGFMILMSSWLFCEGELDLINIHWIETDKLVLFDAYYIVHSELRRGICHYSNDKDSFVFFSESRKKPWNKLE